MTQYIDLDGYHMQHRLQAILYLKEKFAISEDCGHNLDALFDELSTRKDEILITLSHADIMTDNLGDYSKRIIKMLSVLGKTKKNITFEIVGQG